MLGKSGAHGAQALAVFLLQIAHKILDVPAHQAAFALIKAIGQGTGRWGELTSCFQFF